MLEKIKRPEIVAKNKGIEQVEAVMLAMPQADCPISHYFGPNLYIREVTIPAGTIAIGHRQRFDHMNIVLTGKMAIIGKDNKVSIIEGPATFMGSPGQKAGYAIETCIWQNVYSTSETDIDKLEEMFYHKDETSIEHKRLMDQIESKLRDIDREDFLSMLNEVGVAEDSINKQFNNGFDQIETPLPWALAVSVRDSNINGKGLFLTLPFSKGEPISPAIVGLAKTPAVKYVNHSKTPNCVYKKNDDGDIYLVAKKDISGCLGGNKGEELTVDYRESLEILDFGEKLCQ